MMGGGKRNREDNKQEHQENPRKNNARKFIGDFSSPVNFFSDVGPQPYFNSRALELFYEYSNRNQINLQEESPRLGLLLNVSASEISYQLELALSKIPQKNGRQGLGESPLHSNSHTNATNIPTVSLTNQINLGLSQESQKNGRQKLRESPCRHKTHSKATSIPALSLKIGNWEWKSKNDGDLVAKFYYATKKLVWEFLCGSLKKKIEFRWSQISAINAYVEGNNTSRLEIQLKEQPKLCEEINFKPKKRTQWENTANDFTGGQTRICNRHTIKFTSQILDNPFMTLLECDKRIAHLSQQPFPYRNPLFLQHQILDFSCYRSIHGCSSNFPNNEYQGTTVPYAVNQPAQPVRSFIGHSSSNLPTPVLNQTGKLDGILPNHVIDSEILDDQQFPELFEIFMMNDAEFTNQETNFKANPIDQRYEMKSTNANNDRIVFKERNSCLPVEASIGMDDSHIQVNNNNSAYVDDEMFSVPVPFTFQEPFNKHEFSNGDGVNKRGFAAVDDDGDCSELFVSRNSNSD